MEYNKLDKDAFEIIMDKINDLENTIKKHTAHLEQINKRLHHLNMVIMFNNIFDDID